MYKYSSEGGLLSPGETIKPPEEQTILEFATAVKNKTAMVVLDYDHTSTESVNSWRVFRGLLAVLDSQLDANRADYAKSKNIVNFYKGSLDYLLENSMHTRADQTVDLDILRYGFIEILNFCYEMETDVVIYSAGVGEHISAMLTFLQKEGLITKIPSIASNWIHGDRDTLITHHNKNGLTLSELVPEVVHGKTHALIIGDTPNDSQMVEGLDIKEFSIGLLPGHEKLEKTEDADFIAAFNMVMDNSLAPAVDILRRVRGIVLQ